MDARIELNRTLTDAPAQDAGRGLVRLDPADLAALGLSVGDVVAVTKARTTYARVLPAHAEMRGRGLVLADTAVAANTGASLGDSVRLSAASARPAESVELALETGAARPNIVLQRRIAQLLTDRVIGQGDHLSFPLVGGRILRCTVVATAPAGAVTVAAETRFTLSEGIRRGTAFSDIGGLTREIERLREVVELPILRPDLFERLGIDPPKGVLLTGPPGTGKTLIARAVADQCGATFIAVNGPEIISKNYGDSEAELRAIFQKASSRPPAVIFIDEIDAIAPRRDQMSGDRQLERRVVAQLLTLMDGMEGRGRIVVMAATNMPDSLDPALRRPGRFDREIAIGAPDRHGRREILAVHTRGVPLADDVDLDGFAAITHGFVGADLGALVREAGMAALRRAGGAAADAAALSVTVDDFDKALSEVAPSAIRDAVVDIPEVSFADVGGAEELKQSLIEAVVWPLVHADLFASSGIRPAKGVLLAGPPGTGKTLIARALANEAQVNFLAVSGPELLDRFVGESEKAVRHIFAKARSLAPTILFFDEIDALAPIRGEGDGAVSDRVVAQLLTEIDGIEELKAVFLLGATNRPDRIDPALLRPGRFDRLVQVDAPDRATRRTILAIHARRMTLDPAIDLDAVADLAIGFVGADLEAVMQEAGRSALRRLLADGFELTPTLRQADIDNALQLVAASRALRGAGSKDTTS
ncbi:AAA family ATPase [Tardiphaga sp.]|uniref:AAA family ATPase n=1 Tax=Tardiphaga sp. TaxID=1926292 RepID=UPI0025D34EA2|nr:AAA family ATPase [Tardiphaga sp.]